MIRLRLLGGVELVGADGRDINAILQQPKRLAVLAVLAGRTDADWHRRDTLLAMFWPDLDAERARAALRRTLTFLRTHLGETALVTRGDEVAVLPDALWCDVGACLRAAREGRLAEAVDLDRGELLAGVHVPSAPAFEQWRDGTRERIHREIGTAAVRLAVDAERAGSLAAAAAWRRRALELQPHDEAGLRALLSLLDRLGDRAGAIHAYEHFVARLATDLDLTADAETTALVTAIRTRVPTVVMPTLPGAAPAPNVIAVFPFTVSGPPDLHYLREGLVDLLSTRLEGAGDLRTVDPGTVLTHAAPLGPVVDPDGARDAARRLGAGAFLLGGVVADGERTLLRATLHDTTSLSEVRVDAEAGADAGVFDLVDDLVRRLLATRTQSLGGHLARMGARTTESLPALRAYLDGERALRRGHTHASREAYGLATDHDPAFALAHYRLATAHAACGDPVAALDSLERATSGTRRLSPHTRMLLAAQAALLRGALAEAEQLCLRLLADRPDDVEAWFRLARVYLDGNRFRGRPEAEARLALERTHALDPRHAAALADLARLAWATGDRAAAQDHARRYLDLSADGDDAAVMAVIGRTDDAPARLAGARPAALHQVVGMQMRGFDHPAVVPSVASSPWAPILAAHAAAAAGHVADARAALARAAQLDADLALDHEAFLAGLPGCRDIGGDRLLTRIMQYPATPDDPTPAAVLRPVTRLHALAVLHLGSGAVDRAAECARACAAASLPPWAASLATALADGIEARIAFATGDFDRALAVLDGMTLGPWIHLAAEVPQCGLVAERQLRVDVHHALGQKAEAEAWQTPPAALRPLEWALLRSA